MARIELANFASTTLASAGRRCQSNHSRLSRALLCMAALMLLLQAPFAAAGINSFTPMPIDLAGVTSVQHHPARPGVVFASTVGALYRSTDAGASWQVASDQFVNGVSQVAIDPSDPDRVIVAGLDSLAVSADGGATFGPWQHVSRLTAVVFNSDGSAAYHAAGTTIWRSTDQGATWQQHSQVVPTNFSLIGVLRAHPTNPQILYAGLSSDPAGGFFVSTDGAATWQHVALPMPVGIWDLAVSASNPQLMWVAASFGIYKSEDGGASWTTVIYDVGLAVAIDPADDDIVHVYGSGSGLRRTSDGGVTWSGPGPYGPGEVKSISIDVSQPGHVLAGGQLGMYASSDGGASWSPSNAGLRSAPIAGLAFASGQTYLEVRYSGVLVRDYVSGTVTPANNLGLRQLQIYAHPVFIDGLIAQPGLTPQSDRLLVSLQDRLASSTDAGASWTLVALPCTPGASVVDLANSPADPQLIVAACYDGQQGSGGIYRSLDGGNTWSLTPGLPSQAYPQLLAFSRSAPTVVYATVRSAFGQALGVYKSTDAGATWAAAGLDGQGVQSLAVVSDLIAYAAADVGLMRTTDGGNSWSAVSWDPNSGYWTNQLAIDPIHPQIIYAANSERIARSVDNGVTWESLRADVPFSSWWFPLSMGANPATPETLVVGTDGDGAWEMTIAPDLQIEAGPLAPLTQGSPATLTYSLSNQGQFSATGVGATIRLPRGARNVTSSATSGGTCSVAGRTVICTYSALRNTAPAQISVTFIPTRAGTSQVQATVEGDQPDEQSTNNSSQLQVIVESC